MSNKLPDIFLSNFLFCYTSSGKGNNIKKTKWDYIELKSFHSNKTKRQPTEWENIFTNNILNEGLTPEIYREFIQLNTKKQTIQLESVQRT